ncbi:MAG TPA: NEW3 domain-containing protein, partial [Planctomycetota bacterium]|nr:NEW3 domain-containing protein [Planctomycetota bacterium]
VLPADEPPGRPRWIGATFNPFTSEIPDPAALVRLGGFDRLRIVLADAAPAGRAAPSDDRLAEIVRALAAVEGLELTGVLAQPGPDPRAALRAWAARTAGGIDAWEIPGPSGPQRIGSDDLSAVAATASPAPLVLPPAGATDELVRRLVALAASEDRPESLAVSLDSPLTSLMAVRVVNGLLSDAAPGPTTDLLPGVHHVGFERQGLRCLAVWSETPAAHVLDLGPGVRVVSPLGEPRMLRRGERLAVGPMPVFLDGLDPAFLELRSALRLDDPRVRLCATPTARTLTYRNGATALEDARLRIEAPPGWEAVPSEAALGPLAPGQTVSVSLQLRPPAGAAEGPSDLGLALTVRRNGAERRLQSSASLQAVSPVEVGAEIDGARISLRITNRGERGAALLARVRLPGRGEQMEVVGRLDPGASKTFDYRLDAPPPAGARLEADVDERGGDRAWNRFAIVLTPKS